MPARATAPTVLPTPVPGGAAGIAVLAEVLASEEEPDTCRLLVPTYAPAAVQQRLLATPVTAARADAVCCPTSGSTAQPRFVVLPRRTLHKVAVARDEALAGIGAWFIGVPPTTAGAIIAVMRALRSPVPPAGWTRSGLGGFDPSGFAAEAADLIAKADAQGVPARISIVATQLERLLTDHTDTLSRFETVLVGGGPLAASTRAQAERAGITIVATYGATETCGGCVYDGVPVPGVQIRIHNEEIYIAGDTVAASYLDAPLRLVDGWWRSGDRGYISHGRLNVVGRFDDIVTVNGANVDVAAVQAIIAGVPGVTQAAVVAVADPAGGRRLAAHVVGTVDIADVRSAVASELGAAAVPHVHLHTQLPLGPSGKIDLKSLREESQ